jgi:electron transport complex protein RnfB
MTYFVATARCAGCGACLATCPERALRAAPPGSPVPLVTLAERCTGCAECLEVCPVDAFVELEREVALA